MNGPPKGSTILSLMDWNVMEIQRVSLLNGFLTLFYLTIDLALLYRLSPLLYSVDAQITLPKLRKSLHTMFLWISFIITIGFVNLQIVTIYFLWISFRIRIRFVNSFPLNIFYPSGLSAIAWFSYPRDSIFYSSCNSFNTKEDRISFWL